MRPGHRKAALYTILGGLVAVVAWDLARAPNVGRAPDVPQAREQPDRSALGEKANAQAKRPALALPERAHLGEPRAEMFGAQSWQPPAPEVVAAPELPSPPPLPYRAAGRLVQDGQLQVFLSKGDAAIPVRQGEVLDGAYRVESITEDRITLVYVPLGHKETISITGSLGPTTPAAPSASTPGPAASSGIDAIPTASLVAPSSSQPARVTNDIPPPASPPAVSSGIGTIPTSAVIAPTVPPTAAARNDTAPSASAPRLVQRKATRLLWEGPQQVRVGNNFSVALRLVSDQPVWATPMQVRFDPSVLESVAVRPGKYYGPEASRGFNYRVSPDGSIFIGASNPGAAFSPEMELLILTFKPIKPAPAAELSVASLTLEGPGGRNIPLAQPAAFRTAVTP